MRLGEIKPEREVAGRVRGCGGDVESGGTCGDVDGRGTEVVEWVRAIEFLKGWEGGRE
jgi:hypothetical protein